MPKRRTIMQFKEQVKLARYMSDNKQRISRLPAYRIVAEVSAILQRDVTYDVVNFNCRKIDELTEFKGVLNIWDSRMKKVRKDTSRPFDGPIVYDPIPFMDVWDANRTLRTIKGKPVDPLSSKKPVLNTSLRTPPPTEGRTITPEDLGAGVQSKLDFKDDGVPTETSALGALYRQVDMLCNHNKFLHLDLYKKYRDAMDEKRKKGK